MSRTLIIGLETFRFDDRRCGLVGGCGRFLGDCAEGLLPCSVARSVSGRWSCISPHRCPRSRLWSIWGIRPGSVRVRWLRDDPRYADAVPKPPIPSGDAVSRGGIVPVGHAAEAGGGGAWRQRRCGASLDETVPRRRNGGAGDRNGGMPCLRPEPNMNCWAMTRMRCVGGYAGWSRGNALMRGVVGAVYLFNGLCAGLSRVCWPCYR